jgi:gluconate 2-dehydrogenase gamma chain
MSRHDAAGERLSRRELIKGTIRFGTLYVASGLSRTSIAAAPVAGPAEAGLTQTTAREPLETLTTGEAATLDAIAARLIPTDENGPGAIEARATRYIDRALTGTLAGSREAYRNGLAALDAYARASKGALFVQLATADQDSVLREMEENVASGFTPDAATFFSLVRTHTIQGTFSDPYYGGNANFVGWNLLRYPGVRLAATADDQRMDRMPTRVRRSAYDHAMFTKRRPARARLGRTDESWRSS